MSQTVGCEYPISNIVYKIYNIYNIVYNIQQCLLLQKCTFNNHTPESCKETPQITFFSHGLAWYIPSYIPYIIYPIQTIDKYSLNSRLPISNTNLYFPHPWTGCIICILHISPVCPLYAHHMYPISFLHKMHIHFSGHRTNWWIIYSHYISTFCLHLQPCSQQLQSSLTKCNICLQRHLWLTFIHCDWIPHCKSLIISPSYTYINYISSI